MFTAQERYGSDPRVVVRTKPGMTPRDGSVARNGKADGNSFACSWSDWFHEVADQWRDEAWQIIRYCPNLVFQILTKRPERIADHLPKDWGDGFENEWLGVSIETNDYVWRADILGKIPAVVRFVSAEPLLGPLPDLNLDGIHWMIVGGESGPGFRPMDRAWAQQLRDHALAESVAFFFKQSAAPRTEMRTRLDGRQWRQYPQITSREPTRTLFRD